MLTKSQQMKILSDASIDLHVNLMKVYAFRDTTNLESRIKDVIKSLYHVAKNSSTHKYPSARFIYYHLTVDWRDNLRYIYHIAIHGLQPIECRPFSENVSKFIYNYIYWLSCTLSSDGLISFDVASSTLHKLLEQHTEGEKI